MPDTSIRTATLDDALPLAALMTQLGYPTSPEQMQRRLPGLLQRADYTIVVAEREQRLLGAGAAHVIPAIHDERPFALITAMVVDDSARGGGIGRMLVSALEAYARGKQCERILVTSANHREGAHAFYQQIGYDQTGLRFGRPLK